MQRGANFCALATKTTVFLSRLNFTTRGREETRKICFITNHKILNSLKPVSKVSMVASRRRGGRGRRGGDSDEVRRGDAMGREFLGMRRR